MTVEVVGSVRKGGEYEHLTIRLISLCGRRIFDLCGNQFFEFREFGITGGVDFYCRPVRSLKLVFVSLQILQPPFNIKVRHLEHQALTHFALPPAVLRHHSASILRLRQIHIRIFSAIRLKPPDSSLQILDFPNRTLQCNLKGVNGTLQAFKEVHLHHADQVVLTVALRKIIDGL